MPSLRGPVSLGALRRLLRRHRRPLAAALAAIAVLLGLGSLRAPVTSTSPSASAPDPTAPRPGEVAVPIQLARASLAAALRPGDLVDLVTVGASGPEVAAGARVLALPPSGSGLVGGGSASVLVAVPEERALEVAVSPEDGYFLVIRPG